MASSTVVALGAGPSEKKKAEKLPEPEEVALRTDDGIHLALTYYPGTKKEESVPVVLLHMWKRSRSDFKDLAKLLQAQGNAVIMPDLRGHGESKIRYVGERTIELNAASFSAAQFAAMAQYDMGAILQKFLWQKHNDKQLNLNRLCLVGAEMGASVAVEYAMRDWSTPPYGAVQLGQFVKGLVLLSPQPAFKGLNLLRAIDTPGVQDRVAVMILVGAESPRDDAEAKRLYGVLKRFHPDPEGENKNEKRTLWLGELKTKLQGTRMMEVPGLNVNEHIAKFVELRLVSSPEAKELKWKPLKLPHQ